jgi:hypothetical protein
MNTGVERRRVDVKNGNGNHDLTSVAALEDQLERMPAVALPSVRVEEAAPKGKDESVREEPSGGYSLPLDEELYPVRNDIASGSH